MERFCHVFGLLVYFLLFSLTKAAVNITVTGLAVQIRNELVELKFKENAQISTLYVNGTNIANHGVASFYLDWSDGSQHYFTPESIHIVEQTSSRVHFYWLQVNPTNAFTSELHYILEDGLSGIYCYVKFTNEKTVNVSLGLSRIVYRFEETILTQGANEVRTGRLITARDLINATLIQDSTYLLPNGTYYTKYDWGAYTRATSYQGLYGNGHGAFVVSPTREYHDGGSMKQTLTVHHIALMMNSFTSNHYAIGPALSAPPGWQHIYGPFLLYFPTGNSDDDLLFAVEKQVQIEKNRWPYSFVNDTLYPLERGSVSGYISGQTNATVVVYDSLKEDHELQKLGYVFTNKTDSNGYFYINKIRPGAYRIVAYPLAGQGCENLADSLVNISTGSQHVNLTLPEAENIIWSLGEVNRRSDEFKYGNEPRNYEWQLYPPETLNFTIGESDPANDWYYAQTKPGRWYIKYNDTHDRKNRTLRIALAATTRNAHLKVLFNGHNVGSWSHGNDHAIYRSAMQSGQYTYHLATVKSAAIIDGENIVELYLSKGQLMYDAISLQRNI